MRRKAEWRPVGPLYQKNAGVKRQTKTVLIFNDIRKMPKLNGISLDGGIIGEDEGKNAHRAGNSLHKDVAIRVNLARMSASGVAGGGASPISSFDSPKGFSRSTVVLPFDWGNLLFTISFDSFSAVDSDLRRGLKEYQLRWLRPGRRRSEGSRVVESGGRFPGRSAPAGRH